MLSLIGLVMVLMTAVAMPARAHGVSADTDLRFAQTISDTELTVVIRRSSDVPGPLWVDVIAYRPVNDMTIDLVLRSVETGRDSSDRIRLEPGRAGTYPAVLRADQVGPHELELRADGERSIMPFRVLVAQAAPWESIAYGGFATAGVLLVAALIAGARYRRVPAAVLGGGALVALVVAFTVALMSSQFRPVPPQGAAPTGLGRPYVQAAIRTVPAIPEVGEQFALRIQLTDGPTGWPADDLVSHHAALAHLVVTSEDGQFFRHLHPIRTAPGRLEVRLRADRAGLYVAHVELERADSGQQMVTAGFAVAAGGHEGAPARASTAGGVQHPASSAPLFSPPAPMAGRPVTIEIDTGSSDLQPWLEMAGHLIVRNSAGDFLGHAHEQSSMTTTGQGRPGPDETVARHGPMLRFTLSLPEPGRYFAWLQYARDFQIITVPFVITVADGVGTS